MPRLSSVRILDLTCGPVRLGSRMLADRGARVTSPVAADAAGSPSPDPIGDWYLLGKGRVAAVPGCADCGALLRSLAAASDVVTIQSEHPLAAALGDGGAIREQSRATIVATVTPFGSQGPRSGWQTTELVSQAGAALVGREPGDELPPHAIGAPAAESAAGMQLAVAMMLALRTRRITGVAMPIDLSRFEAAVCLTYHHPILNHWFGQADAPGARKRRVWPCKDGFVNWLWWTGPGWGRLNLPLVDWMQEHGLGDSLKDEPWEELRPMTLAPERVAGWEEQFADFFMRFTKRELYDESVKRRIMLYPSNGPADVIEDPQLAARGIFFPFGADAAHPKSVAPGTWAWRDGRPLGPAHRPDSGGQAAGEHERIAGELAAHSERAHGATASAAGGRA